MNKSKLPLGLRLKHHFTEMDFFYKEKKFGAGNNNQTTVEVVEVLQNYQLSVEDIQTISNKSCRT